MMANEVELTLTEAFSKIEKLAKASLDHAGVTSALKEGLKAVVSELTTDAKTVMSEVTSEAETEGSSIMANIVTLIDARIEAALTKVVGTGTAVVTSAVDDAAEAVDKLSADAETVVPDAKPSDTKPSDASISTATVTNPTPTVTIAVVPVGAEPVSVATNAGAVSAAPGTAVHTDDATSTMTTVPIDGSTPTAVSASGFATTPDPTVVATVVAAAAAAGVTIPASAT